MPITSGNWLWFGVCWAAGQKRVDREDRHFPAAQERPQFNRSSEEGRSMIHYDAVVIGSGQAGTPLSQKLDEQNLNVALIEKEHLGGTCVNTGCTPTKTMVASAQVAHYARHAANWGVQTEAVRVDLPSVVARKDRIVSQWGSGVEKKIAARQNPHPTPGAPPFTSPHPIP